MDRNRFETIEAYLLGTMPADQRAVFEAQVSTDADLRAEYELQRENTLAVEWGGVQRLLRQVGAEQKGAEINDRPRLSTFLKVAACLAVVVAAAWWYLARPSANERLFAAHFEADPGLPVPMSATKDLVFQDAMVAYKLGEYAEAITKWSPLLTAEPANDTLRFYIASAHLANGDAAAAIPLFSSLQADSLSGFRDRANWYLFLARVKSGATAEAGSMPLDNDPMHGTQVRAIKESLRR